jgi:hypothetical protein
MAGRFGRFLKLEKARPSPIESRPVLAGRFSGEAAPLAGMPEPEQVPAPPASQPHEALSAPVQEESVAGAELRARRQKELETGLALDFPPTDAEPFTRCGACESDNNRHAVRCQTCRADLDTEQQRVFHRAFWDERRRQSQQESVALEQLQRQRAAAEQLEGIAGDPGGQRALGLDLARRVGEQERQRLAWMDDGFSLRRLADAGSVGMRLLRLIPDTRIRLGAAVGLLGLAIFLGQQAFLTGDGLRHPWSQLFFFALLFLFLPMGGRRRW